MKYAFALALVLLPSVGLAETIALTPDEVEAAKESGARAHARDAALGIDPVQGRVKRDRQIHGEVGVTVGTGGYSEIYGTAVAPLGDTGVLAISVAQERGGHYYGYPGDYRRPR